MKLIRIIAVAAVISAALAASAQGASRSAYFLDGYTFRHELNPAFEGEYNYVSIPGLGDISTNLHSNAGVDNFLFRTTGSSGYSLTTFMSPYVNADDFLRKLPGTSRINADVDAIILGGGFKAFGGFNTVSIGVSADASVKIPKSLFEFAKRGQTGTATEYDINGIKVRANAIANISFGHSHKITDAIRVGGKVRFLLGGGYVRGDIDNLHVRLADDKWLLNGTGILRAAAGSGLVIPTRAESGKNCPRPAMRDQVDWDGIDYNSFSISGYGAAIDLGATWTVIPGLELSAAVNDLGFLCWKDAVIAEMPATEWSFNGFQNVTLESSQPNYKDRRLKTQFDNLLDDFKDAMYFRRSATGTTYTEFLTCTAHIGAEYKMPFYDKLSAAFLYSGHYGDCDLWNEGRVYANVKPAKWFGASVNYAYSTFGHSFGWMLNFHPRGANVFIGSDHMFFKITPQGVPVGRASVDLNLGINITF